MQLPYWVKVTFLPSILAILTTPGENMWKISVKSSLCEVMSHQSWATKLEQGNIFRSMCQEFCPQGEHAWQVGHAWQRGMHGRGACMAGGGMHDRGACMVCGACMAGGMHGRGACMVGGVCGRGGMHGGGACIGGCAWQGCAWHGGVLREHAWQGWHAWWGACIMGGMHGRGVHGMGAC